MEEMGVFKIKDDDDDYRYEAAELNTRLPAGSDISELLLPILQSCIENILLTLA